MVLTFLRDNTDTEREFSHHRQFNQQLTSTTTMAPVSVAPLELNRSDTKKPLPANFSDLVMSFYPLLKPCH